MINNRKENDNMKKIATMILAATICLFFLNVPIAANENDITMQFEELQNKVTEVLDVSGNHYVYSEQEVIDVIKGENFDFSLFNRVNNTDYTEDSFIELALNNIKNADLSLYYTEGNVCTYGTYCGRNYETEGWNYYRSFNNKTRTNAWINQLQGVLNAALLGSISAMFLPNPGGMALTVGFTVTQLYNEGLKDALTIKNVGSCGTVTDINKFYAAYTVWSQEEYFE